MEDYEAEEVGGDLRDAAWRAGRALLTYRICLQIYVPDGGQAASSGHQPAQDESEQQEDGQ
jgi:hypothetical protein